MADITASVVSWSTTESSNQPTDSTTIGAGLDDNLRAIQAGTAREFAKGSDLPSASSVDIGASGTSGFVDITGTTTITSFATARAGTRRWVRFMGALTLTHNATSLILPGGANITTAAGDVALFISLGSGNWLCAEYPTVMASASIAGNVTVGSATLAGNRTLNVANTDTGASSSATASVQSNAGQVQMVIGSTAAGGTSSILSSSTGAFSVYSSQAVQFSLGTNNRVNDLAVDSTGTVFLGGASAATGYAARGDLVLPASGMIRAKNTARVLCKFTVSGGTVTQQSDSENCTITDNGVGDFTINFTEAMANANYVAAGACRGNGGNCQWQEDQGTPTRTVSALRIRTLDFTPNNVDPASAAFLIMGE